MLMRRFPAYLHFPISPGFMPARPSLAQSPPALGGGGVSEGAAGKALLEDSGGSAGKVVAVAPARSVAIAVAGAATAPADEPGIDDAPLLPVDPPAGGEEGALPMAGAAAGTEAGAPPP